MTIAILEPSALPAPARLAASAHPPLEGTLERLLAVRAFSEALCEPLNTEDYVIQTMPDVSPTKWHLAHTSWFFECFLLEPYAPGYAPLHPMYNYLFNSYYNTVGYRHCRPKRGLISRPTVAEVYEYRAHVDRHLREFLGSVDAETWARLAPVVELGIQHEQQHQELMLTDIKHVFSENPLFPAYRAAGDADLAGTESKATIRSASTSVPAPLTWTRFSGGIVDIGHAGPGFAFDNEGPRHQALIQDFELADRPVNCGDYLDFMRDGGYLRHELWLSMGWNRVQEEGWRAPLYWQDHGAEGAGAEGARAEGSVAEGAVAENWRIFTLSGPQPLDPGEPVCHLSYFEADAYARWAGARLPSEFEWEHAAKKPGPEGVFADDAVFHPTAVDAEGLSPAPSAAGPAQLFGGVWEWTRSPYEPYPGYAPSAGALGEYNGKFMCSQYVLRGGSCASSRSHIRASYRNFFPPDARWQFSGLRLARDPA